MLFIVIIAVTLIWLNRYRLMLGVLFFKYPVDTAIDDIVSLSLLSGIKQYSCNANFENMQFNNDIELKYSNSKIGNFWPCYGYIKIPSNYIIQCGKGIRHDVLHGDYIEIKCSRIRTQTMYLLLKAIRNHKQTTI